MKTKTEIVYYTYCFGCGEFIYKGSLRGAANSDCKFINHNTNFGTKKFFELQYPDIETTDW